MFSYILIIINGIWGNKGKIDFLLFRKFQLRWPVFETFMAFVPRKFSSFFSTSLSTTTTQRTHSQTSTTDQHWWDRFGHETQFFQYFAHLSANCLMPSKLIDSRLQTETRLLTQNLNIEVYFLMKALWLVKQKNPPIKTLDRNLPQNLALKRPKRLFWSLTGMWSALFAGWNTQHINFFIQSLEWFYVTNTCFSMSSKYLTFTLWQPV